MKNLNDRDLAEVKDRGISIDELQHQLLSLQGSTPYVELVRPCRVGDGIVRIAPEEQEELLEIHAAAAGAGRMRKFVPASGAATRMFRSLSRYRAESGAPDKLDALRRRAADGDDDASELVRLVEGLPDIAFADALREEAGRAGLDLDALRESGEIGPIVDLMLDPEAFGLGELPKGLVPFHRYAGGEVRTPFEEHLVEAVDTVRERGGLCRLHFTVSPEHIERFAERLREVGPRYTQRFDVAFDVSYSVQKPSTDTIAVGLDLKPFRDAAGKLLFRPGGHGALIENLDELGGDIVYVKNIDNVQPDRVRPAVTLWKRLLGGYLVRLQEKTFGVLRALKAGCRDGREPIDEAIELATTVFGTAPPGTVRDGDEATQCRWLIDRLDRPVRVCGVVENTGEPGGGPFWVRDGDGAISPQVVEGAQIDKGSESQTAALAASTHFNPVDLVCGLKDGGGSSYALQSYVDTDAVIVAKKTHDGRELKALERPGLWNGAMAGWNTVFVEVPIETFSPVKTVLDLLRPEHVNTDWA